MAIEHQESFHSEDEWHAWAACHTPSPGEVRACLGQIRINGVHSDFLGYIPPHEVEVTGENLREKLRARKLNSRQRAVLDLLANEPSVGACGGAKIFAPEAVTRLALELRGRFPFFIGSEYASSPEKVEQLYPIPNEDLQRLSLKSDAFDAVISCDVLEHVPDIPACLREMARVLKPGGVMISTHPFTWRRESHVKAALIDGEIRYLEAPEYHGNPVDPKGSLVFTVPGWDILDQCRVCGFKDAEMVMVASGRRGIFGGGQAFINVLRAWR